MPQEFRRTDDLGSSRSETAAPWPGIDAVVGAFRRLTVLGVNQRPQPMDSSALFYPLVGLVLSALWIVVDHITSNHLVSAFLLLISALLATGGQALLGAGRTLAGLLVRSPDRALEVMAGPFGYAALLSAAAIFSLELLCLADLDRLRLLALAAAPLLGRWAMIVLAFGSRAARPDGRRYKFAPALTFREFGIASTVTFALLFAVTGFLGVIMVIVAAVAVIGLRLLLHRRLDGVTDASVAAACELTQLVTLGLLALF